MNNAEDVTNKLDPPMSRTEAQIQLQNELDNMGFRNLQQGATQYKSYIDETLPGGSNYREVLFRYENAPEPHNVTTHFDDDRALAHALIRDRKLDDGVATLHVDELQSDLHTKGSRDGYKGPELEAEFRQHEAVCQERWLEMLSRIKRLEMILLSSAGATIFLLLTMVVN